MIRLVTLAFALAVAAWCQQVLDNAAVIKLVKSGVGEELVLTIVRNQAGQFDTTPDGVVALKSAGVSDRILSAIIEKASSGSALEPIKAESPAAAASAVKVSPAPVAQTYPKEVGIYSRKASDWIEIDPEIVNWKTGGTLKSLATYGMVKKDLNGHLNGPHSRTMLTTPVEILIYAPEGVSAAEYQLLKLRENKNYREFRTMTGGVFNSKGGADRDLIPFESTKVAPRTYLLKVGPVRSGEYGLIHMGAAGAAGSTSSLAMGKIYTFRLLE